MGDNDDVDFDQGFGDGMIVVVVALLVVVDLGSRELYCCAHRIRIILYDMYSNGDGADSALKSYYSSLCTLLSVSLHGKIQ